MSALIAIVPVRGGSKGLPGKNLRLLSGVPLWSRAASQGLEAGADRVVITTDIPDQLDPADSRYEIVQRSEDLAGDDTPMAPVLVDALSRSVVGPARIVLLQATSPLRSIDDIHACVALHATDKHDLVLSVTETDPGILKFGTMEGDAFRPVSDPAYCFSNRQSLPSVMRPNGAVYVFDKDWFLANDGFVTEKIGAVVMPPERSQDIDTESDFVKAERLLSAKEADRR